jgi:hypothetical protein
MAFNIFIILFLLMLFSLDWFLITKLEQEKRKTEIYKMAIAEVAMHLRCCVDDDYRPETDNPTDEAEVIAKDIYCGLERYLSEDDRDLVSEIFRRGRFPDEE